jgi:hypothetical protein
MITTRAFLFASCALRSRYLSGLRDFSRNTFPIVLGNGKKLFGEGTRPAAFTLVDKKVTTKGVLIARYQRAGNVVTGDFTMDPPTPAEVARRDRMNREG